jgi:N-glycosylase/DNA lyase
MSQSEIAFRVEGFDLRQTLESGQCFRWHCLGKRDYWGVVQGCALRAKQTDADLHVRLLAGVPPREFRSFVSSYFDLERDYTSLLERLRGDPVMASLLPSHPTIRILRQDPFEVIVSFVISANNHIPRIRTIIERLCRYYGSALETPFGRAYTFPPPAALARARVSDLRHRCGVGYRDVYVRSVAQAIAAADFTSWERLPTDVLRARLRELDGVGEKVAECILLFGYHRLEAFPVDTWIFRAMAELYFSGDRPRPADIRALAVRRFGDAAGVAQQYLYAVFRDRHRGNGRPRVPDVSSAKNYSFARRRSDRPFQL